MMKNHKKSQSRPLFLFLDFLIIALAVSGLYLILKPIYIHWQQDNLTRNLDDSYLQGDGTIVIDSDSLAVPGEEVEYLEAVESFATETDPSDTAEPEPSDTEETAVRPIESTTAETGATVTRKPTASPAPTPVKVVVTAIGRIMIPVIDLNMPIAEGATKYNLRVAISHFTNSAGLGQPGNSILFGHRMYTYGRHFNRLGEMKLGDQIIIEDKKNRYTYEVDQIDTILPDRLIYEINTPAEGSRIMLVTCTPVKVASHRLLVKGKLVQTAPLS